MPTVIAISLWFLRRSIVYAAALICLFAFRANLYAQESEKEDLPKNLFGFELGAIYNVGNPDAGDYGNFPVKKFGGFEQFFGWGLNYYFQPLKNYLAFDYVETKKTLTDKYFVTSFSAYIYPVYSANIRSLADLESSRINAEYRVAAIQWAKTFTGKQNAYFWALDFCKTSTVKFRPKPEVVDLGFLHRCTFISGERELVVENIGELGQVRLGLVSEVQGRLETETENFIRKLKAKELLE